MTVLVDWQIHKFIKEGKIGIDPYDEARIQPNSYDLTLSDSWAENRPSCTIDPYNDETIHPAYRRFISDEITIAPKRFFLGESRETILLPDNVVAQLNGKSSLARLGISNHQTGGWIDAGFMGSLTFEVFNCSDSPVKLSAGMPVGQLVFYQTERAENPYAGKYAGQSGATLSRYYFNSRSV